MKKVLLILLVFFVVFLMPFYVKATTRTYTVDGDIFTIENEATVNLTCFFYDGNSFSASDGYVELAPGEIANCQIKGGMAAIFGINGRGTSYFSFDLTTSAGISITNKRYGNNFNNYQNNGTSYTFNVKTISESQMDILSFDIVAPSVSSDTNYTVSLNNIVAKDEFGDNVSYRTSTSFMIKSIVSKSNNNYLSSLSVTGYNMSFSKNTNSYNLTVGANSSQIKINVTKEDSKATLSLYYNKGKLVDINSITEVDIANNQNLSYGDNFFLISVESEFGRTRNYTLVVNRPDNRSKVNTLSTLSLSSGKIIFSSSTSTYNIMVDNTVDKVTLTSTLTDSKSSYVNGYGNRIVNLNYGINTHQIKVQSENGSINTYTLNITRSKNGDNTLKELLINSNKIGIIRDKYSYSIAIDNKVSSVDVKAIPNSSLAKVEVKKNTNLVIGDNNVEIIVTAEDGTKKIYTVIVNREKEISDNIYLKSLNVSDYGIDFSRDKFEYQVVIKNESNLDIKALTESNDSKILVTGNNSLKNGSVIKIRVTAENGKVSNYYIRIVKHDDKNNYIIGSIVFLTGIVLLILAIKYKKKMGKK